MSKRTQDLAVDATVMRQRNAALVLRLIWEAREISRADLARKTGLSASTVSDIIGELRDLELVEEKRTGKSSGGRRPILLGINDRRANALGIEIGSSHMTVVVVSFTGELLCSKRVYQPTREEPEKAIETLHSLIQWCFEQKEVDSERVIGIGVAIPSPVDPQNPGKLSRLLLPAWSGINLEQELQSVYNRPVFIENDANAGALAELWWGEEEVRDLAYVKVATGIGAGFIIDGKLYRGADGSAGEIGHLSVDKHGEECVCGSRGCLATLIGTTAILHRAITIRSRQGESVETIHDFIQAATEGDREALLLLESVGESLGAALAGLLNLLNPRVVVLGGELTEIGDILFDPLRMSLRKHALFSSIAKTRIVASSLGKHAIAIGTTALVLDAALDDLDLFSSTARAA